MHNSQSTIGGPNWVREIGTETLIQNKAPLQGANGPDWTPDQAARASQTKRTAPSGVLAVQLFVRSLHKQRVREAPAEAERGRQTLSVGDSSFHCSAVQHER